MGSYSGGEWKSLKDKVVASKVGKSGGPSKRGGKRATPNTMEHMAFRAEIERQGKIAPPAKASPKSGMKAPKVGAAKAKPAESPAADSRQKIPRMAREVSDVSNKIEAPASSLKKVSRDIKVGGLIGRTGGKWHLGKKVGKG